MPNSGSGMKSSLQPVKPKSDDSENDWSNSSVPLMLTVVEQRVVDLDLEAEPRVDAAAEAVGLGRRVAHRHEPHAGRRAQGAHDVVLRVVAADLELALLDDFFERRRLGRHDAVAARRRRSPVTLRRAP